MHFADLLAAGVLVASFLAVWLWSLCRAADTATPAFEDPLSPELYWD